MSNRYRAIMYYNAYLFIKAFYNLSTKFIMKPGGLYNRDPENYFGVDPLEMNFLRIAFNAIFSYIACKYYYKK